MGIKDAVADNAGRMHCLAIDMYGNGIAPGNARRDKRNFD